MIQKVTVKLPDKNDTFPICTNRISNLDSNIPSRLFHDSIGPETLPIFQANLNLFNLVTRINRFLGQIKNQDSKSIKYTHFVIEKDIYENSLSIL